MVRLLKPLKKAFSRRGKKAKKISQSKETTKNAAATENGNGAVHNISNGDSGSKPDLVLQEQEQSVSEMSKSDVMLEKSASSVSFQELDLNDTNKEKKKELETKESRPARPGLAKAGSSMNSIARSIRTIERNNALSEVEAALHSLRPFQLKPLTKQDKVLVMQHWNKMLAFKTAFSEALIIYWRILCCGETPEAAPGKRQSTAVSQLSYPQDPMDLIEKNEDPLYGCLSARMEDAEDLIIGLLDNAIRSLCPAHQHVQRESYRPMQHDAIIERANGEFTLECQTLEDHLSLFARLGIKPEYWVRFVSAVHWTMQTHTPYAQEDDLGNLEQGPIHSALGRVVALFVASPAINTYKELVTLYQVPLVIRIQALWGTFSEVARHEFGEVFYRKLLSEHPQLIDYFSKTDMDSLAMHLSMALDMVIKNVRSMGISNTTFRTALNQLAEIHRRMNVPTYSYALVGSTILECFQPIFEKEEEDSKDTDDPVTAAELKAGLKKVYGEIMSIVYYPMLKQEKMLQKVQDFYEQVKEELDWSDSQLQARLLKIEEEIQLTGTYIQTTEELEIGARLAWRNSAKCIGRIAWNTLKIRDCRHVNDPDKIFDELRNHIMEATAGTNIQSIMTVFKPQSPSEVYGLRFWSSQLVRYAAYKNIMTGEITGDPANLELTEYLINNKLWDPPQQISQFDVLPVVLKVPGKKTPIVKQLPKDCIFEVNLEHPTNPELSKLGLRWTTVPAISNFKMNLGGIVYQNMPFNGWFVTTEIVRNLMERYDVGPKMAKVCGLDTDNDPMWRVTVSCELERMVLHSFQKHRFTIVDPMTVGKSFCTHVQRERENGRECPAQWSWIGGLVGPTNPTWHLEMRDFLINPQYEYCSEGMLLHNAVSSSEEADTRTCTSATESISTTNSLSDLPELPKVLILFGSQTGNAESAARRLKRVLRLSKPTMMTLNEAKGLEMVKKNSFTHVLIVCSTFGDGKAPTNAQEFFEMDIPGELGNNKKFAVLGLGSSIYPKFCQAADSLDKLLKSSGFEAMTPTTKADEAAGSDGTVEDWIGLMKALVLPPNILEYLKDGSGEDEEEPPISKICWLSEEESKDFVPPAPSTDGSLCISNDQLLGKDASRPIHKITFRAPAEYESGDHLSVMPQNSDEMVKRFLRCFGTEFHATLGSVEGVPSNEGGMLDKASKQPFDVQVLDGTEMSSADVSFQTPATLGHILKNTLNLSLSSKDVVDLMKLVKRLVDDRLHTMKKAERDDILEFPDMQKLLLSAKSILDSHSKDRTQAQDDFISSYPTIVDFLEVFKEILLEAYFDDKPVVGLADILSILGKLQPRFYSISSSNKVSPDEISITVGVLEVTTSKGVKIKGVCSNYLAALTGGESTADVSVFKSSFRLPENPESPILMVGAGTGLAPMMGFLEEKELESKSGVTTGEMHLFFGCRNMNDFIYQEKIEGFESDKLITLHHALSRSGSVPKTYVQDKITAMGKELADLLQRDDTHYYVCGDARMANSCYENCINVLRKHAVMSRVRAVHHLKQMQAQGRWQTDVWGIVSDYENSKKMIMKSKRAAAKIWLQSFN